MYIIKIHKKKKKRMSDAPDAKRQRILDSIALTNTDLGMDEEIEPEENEPMSYEELIDIGYVDCYACKHMNIEALNVNDKYLTLMKLYTQNASTICRPAIFKMIKEYFDEFIVADLILIEKARLEYEGKPIPPDNEIVVEQWSMECIKEHFDRHTNFPSDEIIVQLRIKRSLRSRLTNNLIEITPAGKQKFNSNNIKLLVTLDKEIQVLLKLKKDISTMVGYNPSLDF